MDLTSQSSKSLSFSIFSTSPPGISQIPSKAVSKVNIPGGMEMLLPCHAPRQLPIPWIPQEGPLSHLCFPLIPVSVSWKRAGKICSLSRPHKCKRGWKTTPPALCLHFNSSPRKKRSAVHGWQERPTGDSAYPKHSLPHSRFITTSNRLSFPPSELDEFSIWDVFLVLGTVLSSLPTCVGSCSALPNPDNYFSGCFGTSGNVVGSAQIDPSQSNAWNKPWINP